MFFNSIKEINRLKKKLMKKTDVRKTFIFKVQKIYQLVTFWGDATHADIIEF